MGKNCSFDYCCLAIFIIMVIVTVSALTIVYIFLYKISGSHFLGGVGSFLFWFIVGGLIYLMKIKNGIKETLIWIATILYNDLKDMLILIGECLKKLFRRLK